MPAATIRTCAAAASRPITTQAEWIGAVGVALQPLVDAMRRELLARGVLHADETPVEQLDPGAGNTRRAYLFAYRSAGEDPIVVFDYCASRSGEHARRFLGDWRGALMVDDFAGYKASFAHPGMIELGCWAHARRKFVDLHKASGSPVAAEAIARIAVLYRIEQEAADLTPEARHARRQQKAVPVLHALHAWLRELRPKVVGNSGTARAIDYCLKRWAALARYADDGRYPIDNNPIENAIRPVALGRKNWLFAGSHAAGCRAAAAHLGSGWALSTVGAFPGRCLRRMVTFNSSPCWRSAMRGGLPTTRTSPPNSPRSVSPPSPARRTRSPR
jgi:transposase